jgi:hypothetical protein
MHVKNNYWIKSELYDDMKLALKPLNDLVKSKNPQGNKPVMTATYLFINNEMTVYESAHYWATCKTPISQKKEEICYSE